MDRRLTSCSSVQSPQLPRSFETDNEEIVLPGECLDKAGMIAAAG